MLDTLSLMGAGFLNALTPINLLMMAAGVAMGIVIGCMPGLSAAMGVALMLPMTFTMKPETGLIVLGAIYCGAIFGGSISAILIHTPGTPASAATAIEGYQMTLRGQAGKALFTACYASFWGGLLSCVSLYFFSPLLAKLTLKFMSAEYFWLSIFGLTIIAGVSSKSVVKGLMSGALGLLISTIGLDPITGVKRCALIGLFSMSQVFILAEKKIKARAQATKFSDKMSLSREERKILRPTIVRSWIIGNLIGILPGAGASIACFLGYNTSRQFSRHKEMFGKGSIEGVARLSDSDSDTRHSGRVRYRGPHGRPGNPGPDTGAGALRKVRPDDLHLLCGLRSGTVLHAGHRPSGLPRLCTNLPSV